MQTQQTPDQVTQQLPLADITNLDVSCKSKRDSKQSEKLEKKQEKCIEKAVNSEVTCKGEEPAITSENQSELKELKHKEEDVFQGQATPCTTKASAEVQQEVFECKQSDVNDVHDSEVPA